MTQLRCWPGCIARVIVPNSVTRDRIVACIRLLSPGEELQIEGATCEAAPPDWGPTWHVRGRLLARAPDGSDMEIEEGPLPDKALQPLIDPGDGARDETLEWLPVPTKEAEPCAQS